MISRRSKIAAIKGIISAFISLNVSSCEFKTLIGVKLTNGEHRG